MGEDFDIEDELHFLAEPYLFEPEWTEEELRQRDEAAAAASGPDHEPPDLQPAAAAGPDQEPLDHQPAAAAAAERSRAQETWWCRCTKCRAMPTDEESLCCADWEPAATPTLENLDMSGSDAAAAAPTPTPTPTPCITDHQEFPPLLTRGVLQMMIHSSLVSWKTRPRPDGPGGRLSEQQCRSVAFRVVLEWVLKGRPLPAGGPTSQVLLPSCVVGAVRDAYPSPSPTGRYEGPEELESAFQELL